MTSNYKPGKLDFPGAFTAAVVAAGFAVFWPWYVLHGVARVVTGIPWTGCALVIAFLIARAKLAGGRR